MKLHFHLAALICAFLLTGCGPTPEPDSHSYTIIALGTLVTVEMVTADESRALQARDRLQALLRVLERDWYAFGDGELGRINAALAAGAPVQTTPELAALIKRSLNYRTISDGLFEPVIGNLIELWGFANFATQTELLTPPPDAAVHDWRDNPAPRLSMSVTGQTIRATGPVRLDLGGVAKGTVLMRATALLEQLGIHNAMVDAGGDLKVIGSRGKRPWRVGIRNPHADNILATIELKPGEAIVTSGNYERYFEHDGQRYNHVLNPQTGRPVEATAGVTVLHSDAELADAAATALMVAGPDRFDEITARMGITTALLVNHRGELQMTSEMSQRLVMAATPQ
jgi:thiamine biosynthesis lipoprotein